MLPHALPLLTGVENLTWAQHLLHLLPLGPRWYLLCLPYAFLPGCGPCPCGAEFLIPAQYQSLWGVSCALAVCLAVWQSTLWVHRLHVSLWTQPGLCCLRSVLAAVIPVSTRLGSAPATPWPRTRHLQGSLPPADRIISFPSCQLRQDGEGGIGNGSREKGNI